MAAVIAVVGSPALVAVPAIWMFCADEQARQWSIVASLAVVLGCLATVALRQRGTGHRSGADTFAELRPVPGNTPQASGPPALPARLPARWPAQLRGAAAVFCCTTAFLGFVALAAGDAERPAPVDGIAAAGGVIQDVRVTSVRNSERHNPSRGHDFYTATSVVALPEARTGRSVPATVSTNTPEPLRPGSEVTVLYAPSKPGLGAVQGKPGPLRASLDGAPLAPGARTALLLIWLLGAGFLGGLQILHSGGFRTLTRWTKHDRAVRGRCAGDGISQLAPATDTGTEQSGRKGASTKLDQLVIATDGGEVRFVLDEATDGYAEQLGAEPLWLCWRARQKDAQQLTSAVLIGDSGWALHGQMVLTEAERLAENSETVIPGGAGAPVDSQREARVWDPRAGWPLRVGRGAMTAAALALVLAGLLATTSLGAGRWWAAAGGVLCVLGAVAAETLSTAWRATAPNGSGEESPPSSTTAR
ncbi:DUF3592 domain-containing protein [Streptomyces sp. Isolate_219]|uniref:DUF3592 domain-containing protein n=1 Tax=Streptomyces sp. Isolate_219 TaxID=2950110 RepID=UPI0021C713D7|nr:DUF3592 domain-containing protein [Streptomyces sp. Isolate_219]MCR8572965.1 hypothetical protein [Streptomyces sp. Isolate_219]